MNCADNLTNDEPSCGNLRNVLEDQHVAANKRYFNALVEDSANNRFYLYDACGRFVELASGGGGGLVSSVNGETGTVSLITDDISDITSTRKYTTAANLAKLSGIEAGAQVNVVTTVNGSYGTVMLNTDDLSDVGKTHKFVTASDITNLATISSLVPNTRTINTKPLNANIVLTQDDVTDGATNKQYSSTEKTKLSGIDASATMNDTDANLRARANHTGTQLASTISDIDTAGWTSVPATASSTGTAGQRAYSAGFLYICTLTNTWERVATATW